MVIRDLEKFVPFYSSGGLGHRKTHHKNLGHSLLNVMVLGTQKNSFLTTVMVLRDLEKFVPALCYGASGLRKICVFLQQWGFGTQKNSCLLNVMVLGTQKNSCLSTVVVVRNQCGGKRTVPIRNCPHALVILISFYERSKLKKDIFMNI